MTKLSVVRTSNAADIAKAAKEVKPEKVFITPAMAMEMLGGNILKYMESHINRPVIPKHELKLWLTFKKQEMKFNGSSICVDTMGRVLDGQHRLIACIKSGVPFWSIVVWNVDPSCFGTYDGGRVRTAGDIFGIGGWDYPKIMAAVARHVYLYEMGAMKKVGSISTLDQAENRKLVRGTEYAALTGLRDIDKLELLAFATPEKAEYEEAHKFVLKYSVSKIMSVPLAVAVLKITAELDKPQAYQFMKDLATGILLKGNDPVYKLRAKLEENARSKAKLGTHYIFAFIAKTWNARRQKKKITSFRISEGEAFPVMK